MSFLGQLKQRNVFRIGMFYIVAAWVLIQVMDTILQDFAAPDWVLRFVVLMCFLGFPIALWLSWIFAMTPEGLRLEKHIDRSQMPPPKNTLDYLTMALLAVVLGLVAFERLMPVPAGYERTTKQPVQVVAEQPPPEPVEILENSIAVLPFQNMSGEAANEYFSDGLSEELLNALTHVDGLNVASRTSSFAFKGTSRSIRDVAQVLRVATVLEGSVRRAGDRLRITAQLIDASTDVHLWSDSYDREMTDIFQVQEEIANAIVAALTAELGVGLSSVNIESLTSNLDAYDLYLRGRELFIARENMPTSWELLQQATRLDPDFARAWETLAAVHSVATSWFPGDGIEHQSLALSAARRALELDPTLSMPHAVIGMKHEVTGTGYAGAIEQLDKAIENDPRNATAYLWRAITLKDMGYFDHSREDLESCLAIDRDYLNCRQHLAETLLLEGKIEPAIREFESTLEYNFHSTSDAFVSYYVKTGQKKMAYLVAALAIRSQFAPIREWVHALENPRQDHSTARARFEEWGADQNIGICEMDLVAVALKATECYDNFANARMMWQPDTADYRKTPEFKAWVKEHLMDFWHEHGLPEQCRMLDDEDFECD